MWDKTNQRLRVTGRELIILKTAGYICTKYQDYIAFLPPQGARKYITLQEICAAVEQEESRRGNTRDLDSIWQGANSHTITSSSSSPTTY